MSTNTNIADVQAFADDRNIAINKVGIRAVKHPVSIVDIDRENQPLSLHGVATFDMYVGLAPEHKGTHMSRFLDLLNERPVELSVANLGSLVDGMMSRLESESAYLEANFDLLLAKKSPVSQILSYLDYQITLKARVLDGEIQTGFKCVVPVATLCPCSKEISEYGAHNQRSHVTFEGWVSKPTYITPLITLIEKQASCELYGTLKRVDEKWVTERAYENPKFVEDLVRDIAVELNRLDCFTAYRISSENFESIHNHSAYAEIVYP